MKRVSTAEVIATSGILVVVCGAVYLARQFVKGGALLAQAPKFLQGVAAIGILTMALLQLVKGLLSVRGRFQERLVMKWIERGLSNTKSTADDVTNVLKELRRLAVTNENVDLFNLPIEQLCGQITAAAEPLLDYPEDMNDNKKWDLRSLLVLALAGSAGSEEALNYKAQRKIYINDRQKEGAEEKFLAYRQRLTHHFQRNIDGLQIEVTQKWRRMLWVAALLLGTTMAGLGSASLGSWQEKTALHENSMRPAF